MKESVRCTLDDALNSAMGPVWKVEYLGEYETPAGREAYETGEGWSHMNPRETIFEERRCHMGAALHAARTWATESGFKCGPARILDYDTGFEMKLTRP